MNRNSPPAEGGEWRSGPELWGTAWLLGDGTLSSDSEDEDYTPSGPFAPQERRDLQISQQIRPVLPAPQFSATTQSNTPGGDGYIAQRTRTKTSLADLTAEDLDKLLNSALDAEQGYHTQQRRGRWDDDPLEEDDPYYHFLKTVQAGEELDSDEDEEYEPHPNEIREAETELESNMQIRVSSRELRELEAEQAIYERELMQRALLGASRSALQSSALYPDEGWAGDMFGSMGSSSDGLQSLLTPLPDSGRGFRKPPVRSATAVAVPSSTSISEWDVPRFGPVSLAALRLIREQFLQHTQLLIQTRFYASALDLRSPEDRTAARTIHEEASELLEELMRWTWRSPATGSVPSNASGFGNQAIERPLDMSQAARSRTSVHDVVPQFRRLAISQPSTGGGVTSSSQDRIPLISNPVSSSISATSADSSWGSLLAPEFLPPSSPGPGQHPGEPLEEPWKAKIGNVAGRETRFLPEVAGPFGILPCRLLHLWSRRRGDYYDESTWNAVTDRHLMLASMSLQSAFSSFPKGGNEFFNRVLGQATNILFAEQYPELRGYFREQLGPGLIALAPTAAEQFLPAELRLLELAESTFTPELHQSIAPETWEKMQTRFLPGKPCYAIRDELRNLRLQRGDAFSKQSVTVTDKATADRTAVISAAQRQHSWLRNCAEALQMALQKTESLNRARKIQERRSHAQRYRRRERRFEKEMNDLEARALASGPRSHPSVTTSSSSSLSSTSSASQGSLPQTGRAPTPPFMPQNVPPQQQHLLLLDSLGDPHGQLDQRSWRMQVLPPPLDPYHHETALSEGGGDPRIQELLQMQAMEQAVQEHKAALKLSYEVRDDLRRQKRARTDRLVKRAREREGTFRLPTAPPNSGAQASSSGASSTGRRSSKGKSIAVRKPDLTEDEFQKLSEGWSIGGPSSVHSHRLSDSARSLWNRRRSRGRARLVIPGKTVAATESRLTRRQDHPDRLGGGGGVPLRPDLFDELDLGTFEGGGALLGLEEDESDWLDEEDEDEGDVLFEEHDILEESETEQEQEEEEDSDDLEEEEIPEALEFREIDLLSEEEEEEEEEETRPLRPRPDDGVTVEGTSAAPPFPLSGGIALRAGDAPLVSQLSPTMIGQKRKLGAVIAGSSASEVRIQDEVDFFGTDSEDEEDEDSEDDDESSDEGDGEGDEDDEGDESSSEYSDVSSSEGDEPWMPPTGE